MIIDSPIISGSYSASGSLNQFGNVVITGSLTITGGITGSISGSAISASYASNADLLDGLDSTVFTLTSSFNAFTASVNTTTASFSGRVGSLEAATSSLQNATASLQGATASLFAATASFSSRVGSLESATSSLYSYTSSLNAKTSSFATTGSNVFIGTQTITGSINQSGSFVSTGTITAQTLIIQTITASQEYITGSSVNGSLLSNTHQFTGSVLITGSLAVNGSNAILTNQTSSMSASYAVSASYASTSTSASFATSASSAVTASYWSGSINNVLSASYALTASYSANVPVTASYANNANSASYASTASFATTASYLSGYVSPFPFTGSAIISGSLTVTGSANLPNITGSLQGTASYAVTASNAVTASYLSGYVSPFPFTGSAIISGSLTVTGSLTITGSNTLIGTKTITGSVFITGSKNIIGTNTVTGSMLVSGSTGISGSLTVNSLSGSGVRYLVADESGSITAQSASAALKSTQAFTSTAGQTTFAVTNGYSTGYVDVFINGSKLATAEFTDTSGTNIVLATGSFINDTVEVVKYTPAAGVTNNVLRQLTTLTGSAGQTVFSASYTPGLLDIFYNGSRLSPADFTANNGTFFTLATGSAANDILDVLVYSYQVGAFSGIGGQGVANQLSFFNTTSSISGSTNLTYNGSTLTLVGNKVITGSVFISGSKTIIGTNTITGSLFVTGSQTFIGTKTITGSVFITGSKTVIGNNTVSGSMSISGSLDVNGTITATTLVVQTVSSSVIYSSGSNVFGNSAANTQTFTGSVLMNPNGLFVSSSGLVGIGTSTPSYTLDVTGTGRFTGNTIIGTRTTGNIRNLNIYGGTNNNAILKLDGADGNGYGAQLEFISKNSGGTSNQWTIGTGITTDSNTFEFWNGSAVVMAATIAGNVGIGTSSPASLLHLASSVAGTSVPFFIQNTNASGTGAQITFAPNANFGFGDNAATISSSTSAGGYDVALVFGTYKSAVGPAERMRITGGGNVGVGISGVYSDVRFMTRGASATSSDYAFRAENSSGGNILYLRNDGLFGGGTLALSPYSFDPGGHIMYVNSVGQIGSLSSTRESKINIKTISNIDYIYKLNPVSFNMRKRDETTYEYTDEYNEEIRYGFIADEVEKLNEDLVVYNNNDGQKKLSSVNYISMIALLTKAIQKQQTLITALQEKLERNNIN
jgi:hypothetical protein